MRHKSLWIATLAASMLFTGCAQSARTKTTKLHMDIHSVAVRFKMPPEPKQFATSQSEFGTKLVLDPMYDGFVDSSNIGNDASKESDVVHLALWGSGYDGFDVTHRTAPLAPGAYTFAYLDPDYTTAIQGWVHVNDTGDDMIHFLKKWLDRIPEQKQWIAYDLELQGKLDNNDAGVFKSFAKQLRAFDRLERQLTKAIMHETREQHKSLIQNNEFLNSAEVLILPGGNGFFHPTTRAAFTKNDVTRVRSGETMSKMLLVADYDSAQWKLQRINHIRNELIRCKNVLMSEVDRLERRKRLLALTDHLFNHDRKFVDNEMRLQQTLASIDSVNEQLIDLRQRRTAMAFISEMVAPDRNFRPLDEEQRDLMKERVVLETLKNQINLLFNEVQPKSGRRVVLERKRQDVIRAMEGIDNQLNRLAEARVALRTLRRTSDVIHRQGERRMMTASFVDQRIPFHVREALEREALMTVRLQSTQSMFVPMKTTVKAMTTSHRGAQHSQKGSTLSAKDQFEIASQLAHEQANAEAKMIQTQMLMDDVEFNQRRTRLAQAYSQQAQFQAQVEAQDQNNKMLAQKDLQARLALQKIEADKAHHEALRLAKIESQSRRERDREQARMLERQARRAQEEDQARRAQKNMQLAAQHEAQRLARENQQARQAEQARKDRAQQNQQDHARQARNAEIETQRIALAESKARRAWEQAEAQAAEREARNRSQQEANSRRWNERRSDENRRRGQLVNNKENNQNRWNNDNDKNRWNDDQNGNKNQNEVECELPLLIRILVPPCWFNKN